MPSRIGNVGADGTRPLAAATRKLRSRRPKGAAPAPPAFGQRVFPGTFSGHQRDAPQPLSILFVLIALGPPSKELVNASLLNVLHRYEAMEDGALVS